MLNGGSGMVYLPEKSASQQAAIEILTNLLLLIQNYKAAIAKQPFWLSIAADMGFGGSGFIGLERIKPLEDKITTTLELINGNSIVSHMVVSRFVESIVTFLGERHRPRSATHKIVAPVLDSFLHPKDSSEMTAAKLG